MAPLHAHFAVDDLAAGVHFYSMMFASKPTVLMPNYAMWMLDDPRVAFAISRRCPPPNAIMQIHRTVART